MVSVVPQHRTVEHHGTAGADEHTAQPVTFNGCFGWLHARPAQRTADTAVLLCTGLTYDKLCGHRSFRQLADALAAAGYPSLRFDYPNTGDSCDDPYAEHWSLWQQSIHTAADWLRVHSGARRVVLVGLRIGATLAAVVAEKRGDIAALVLIEPVLRGQSYVRHLSLTLRFRGAEPPRSDGRLDLHELLLSKETVDMIGKVDLRRVRPPEGSHVCVIAQSQTPVLATFQESWRTLGANITSRGIEGLEPVVRPTFMNHEPNANVSGLIAWLRGVVPSEPSSLATIPVADRASLRDGRWQEAPLRFGSDDHLFGILCNPDRPALTDTVVIIVNSSGHPHHGDNRFAVEFARRLAACGFSSLRMDFAGLGDSTSPGPDSEAPTHIMEADRAPDVSAAIDALQGLGYSEFALHGLCSGAYHAFHGTLADPRVTLMLLVNLPMLTWRKGDRIETVGAHGPTQYLRRMGRPATWKLLFERQLDLARPVYGLRSKIASLHDATIRMLARRFRRNEFHDICPAKHGAVIASPGSETAHLLSGGSWHPGPRDRVCTLQRPPVRRDDTYLAEC